MSDMEFIELFENCKLSKEEFTHQLHMRMAFTYLHSNPFPEALIKIRNGIKKFADFYNLKSLYNETITFWFACLIYDRMIDRTYISYQDFISDNSDLVWFEGTMKKYYSEETFRSIKAKNVFILPEIIRSQNRS